MPPLTGNRVYIVTTGFEFSGLGLRSIQSTIEEMIMDSQHEIIIATYAITGRVEELFRLLEDAASRGVNITIMINHLSEQPEEVRGLLLSLSRRYPNVTIYDFYEVNRAMHMKVVAVDRKRAFIGSANITWRGMTENLEVGVVVEGESAEKISNALGELLKQPSFRIFSGEN